MSATLSTPNASPAGLMPPHESRWAGPMLMALVAHALLAAALTWGIGWNHAPVQPAVVEAELWSKLPQSAAPRAEEPNPQPTPQPEPEPPPTPEPVQAKPTPPRPDPVATQQALDAQRDADIALQQQKKREEARREEEKRQQLEALKKKQAQEREAKELAQQKERQKLEEKQAEKRAAEKKAAEQAAKDKANEKALAAQMAKERSENLKRISGMAGATGDANSTGTAQKSSGPSATYAGRIIAAVRPNIIFTDTPPSGNPSADVEVRTFPDGTIASRRLVKSSGSTAWDEAVLKALERTARLPRDEDGRVPSTLVIGFRPRD